MCLQADAEKRELPPVEGSSQTITYQFGKVLKTVFRPHYEILPTKYG